MRGPRYDFEDEVVFVTGAARGLGMAIATQFADHGADLVLVDRCVDLPANPYSLATRDDLEETATAVRERGGAAVEIVGDVRDGTAVDAAMATGTAELGELSVVIHNAGIWNGSPALALDETTWDEVVDVSLTGARHCLRYGTERLAAAGDGGRIVCTGSIGSLVGTAGAGHYAAAKHGVRGLVAAAARDLAGTGITVNAVCPTGMATPMIDGVAETQGEDPFDRIAEASGAMNVLDGDLLDPSAVAEAYLWLASDAARAVSGVALPVDAGATAK